ncbi:MAG: hypothetical protein ACRYFV_09175 [Janthinobacterium lividum]
MVQHLSTRLSSIVNFIIRRSWALPVVAILLWANWEAPEMHHFVRPVEMIVWQLAPLATPAAAQNLATQLATEPGVSACAVSPRTHCVAFVYHPAEVSPEALYEAVEHRGGRVLDHPLTNAPKPALRQCPVPTGYLLLLDQMRFALNLRRFFVSV